MDTGIPRPEHCAHCGSTELKLRRQLIVSGAAQIAWRCLHCGRWAETSPHWIAHDTLLRYLRRWDAKIDTIPLVADYSVEQPCIICGKPGEYHHWAPQCLADAFGEDWGRWPGAALCVFHHRLWHDTVTPELSRIKARV